MKKYLVLVATMTLMFALFAAPASAATLRVSSKVTAAAPVTRVGISGTISRAARVRVVIYRGVRAVRTLSARVSNKRYSTSWNLKTAAGASAASGLYTYRVTAIATGARGAARGRIRVPVPAPAPVLTPITGASRWFGFYQKGNLETVDALNALEAQLATTSKVVNLYVADTDGFPVNRARTIADRGSIPMITLEFFSTSNGGVDIITNGSRDADIIRFADAAKAHGREIYLRPFHEMNSNWYPWAGATNGNSAAKVVAAWKHVKDIFAARGATNVKFVWCVNNESVPNTAANAISAYWPGDAYVDMLAADAYNFGTSASWSTWRSFSTAMNPCYATITGLSAKPFFLAEAGCAEQGGNKAAWITDMFNVIKTSYPRLTGICWFNVNDLSTTNTDWRVDSSAASLAAFQAGVVNGY
ncbi:MAG: glycosyl hydrolase [Coriobacteriia bacterium]|nr:glycosyl hydrolase [Coriobacteriia bacterium]